MKREIKFRAWDNKTEKFLYPYPEGFNVLGEVTAFCLIEQQIRELTPGTNILDRVLNDIILLQFTGLYDKNRNEIYEGDILHSQSWPTDSRTKKHNHIVEWKIAEWVATGYNGDMKVSPSLSAKRDFEIIGNIYENPELL